MLSKLSIPIVMAASIAGGALSAGMVVGSSKDRLDTHAADIAELKVHDRESNGDIHELKADVKELRRGIDRIETALGTKR